MAEIQHRQSPNALRIALVLWVIYSGTLFKMILMDSWGMIAAGIGDLEMDGLKVGILSFIPYVGISMFLWTWQSMSSRRLVAIIALIAWVVIVGLAAYCRLWLLHERNRIVHPNNTAVYFSMVNLVFMAMLAGLYRFGKINSAPYL